MIQKNNQISQQISKEEEIRGNVMQQLLENFDSIFDTLLEEDLINDNVDYIKNNETFRKRINRNTT